MAGALQDRGTFKGIALTLLALALLAERAAGRSFPVRVLVLLILYRAEAIARTFVARAIESDGPDWPYPDEPSAMHYGAADAGLLALRLRMLAAVLGALADATDVSDDHSAGWAASGSANSALRIAAAPDVLLVICLSAARRPLQAHDTS